MTNEELLDEMFMIPDNDTAFFEHLLGLSDEVFHQVSSLYKTKMEFGKDYVLFDRLYCSKKQIPEQLLNNMLETYKDYKKFIATECE